MIITKRNTDIFNYIVSATEPNLVKKLSLTLTNFDISLYDVNSLSMNPNLPEYIINEYIDKLDLSLIAIFNKTKLSGEFLTINQFKLGVNNIVLHQDKDFSVLYDEKGIYTLDFNLKYPLFNLSSHLYTLCGESGIIRLSPVLSYKKETLIGAVNSYYKDDKVKLTYFLSVLEYF